MNEKVLERKKEFFWLVNGTGVRSLRELADALPTLSEEEFSHHVTAEKNDFANWIRDLFDEYRLSELLRNTKTRAEFQSALYNQFAQKELLKKKEQVSENKTEEKDDSRDVEVDVINNPQDFIKYHEKEAEQNDKTADRFDAVATKFEESIHPETPQHVEKRIEDLEERYKELHSRIAEARKLGKDPLIADFTLRPVSSKLAYARVTHQETDFLIVERIFTEAEKELAEALAFEEPDAKKEVEELVQKGQRPIAIEQTANPEAGGGV
ncbi:hypothetical protein GOV07_05965 [Candidatus Woesearchaeota archaeon]|nr:hypothetical protein [Candidatus Woesearchaeota archaeon]